MSSGTDGGMGGGKSSAEDKREQRLKLIEDHIGRAIAESEANGELKSAPSFGKPMSFGDGYDETPAELRMPMKILKDAGVVPPEVEVMRAIAKLQADLDALPSDDARVRVLLQQINDKRQALALRLEKLRLSSNL